MTAEATSLPTPAQTYSKGQIALGLVGIALGLTILRYVGVLPEWLHRLPETLVPNFAGSVSYTHLTLPTILLV